MSRSCLWLLTMLLLPACASQRVAPPLEATIQHWPAQGEVRGVILGLHSFGDSSRAFALSGAALARSGYQVYSYDQAGFGKRTLDGRWAGEQTLVDEAADLTQVLACRHRQPVFLLGESLGGAVALLVASRQPDSLAGVVLAAPAVREGIRLRYGWNALIASAATLAPGYRLTVDRQPDDPTLAPSSARRLAKDDSVMRRVRMDTYWGLIKLADSASDMATEVPVASLLLYGGEDGSVPAVGIQHLRERLGPQNRYRFYPQGPHLLLQGRHWSNVTETIQLWLDTQPTQSDGNLACPSR